jgi:hypothetical protein
MGAPAALQLNLRFKEKIELARERALRPARPTRYRIDAA